MRLLMVQMRFYAGQPRYSLRVRNNEFNHANLKIGIDEAHSLGKNSM